MIHSKCGSMVATTSQMTYACGTFLPPGFKMQTQNQIHSTHDNIKHDNLFTQTKSTVQ